MTAIIRIDPDGTITDVPGRDLLGAAERELGNLDIVTLRNPVLGHDAVGALGEWSTGNEPTNWKAWALYGRSMLCGPVFVALDQEENGYREDLPDEVVALLRTDIAEWCPEMAALREES